MKNLVLYIVSVHRKFFQNRFINEYTRKNKATLSSNSVGNDSVCMLVK